MSKLTDLDANTLIQWEQKARADYNQCKKLWYSTRTLYAEPGPIYPKPAKTTQELINFVVDRAKYIVDKLIDPKTKEFKSGGCLDMLISHKLPLSALQILRFLAGIEEQVGSEVKKYGAHLDWIIEPQEICFKIYKE